MTRPLLWLVPWLATGLVRAQAAPEEFGNPWMANLVELEPPPPVPLWPPAPGWYVVAGTIGLGLLWLLWRALRTWRANAYRREAVGLVRAAAHGAPDRAVGVVATVLKRVALTTFGRERTAPLAEGEWLVFLDRTGKTEVFSNGVGRWLTEVRYAGRDGEISPVELDQLVAASTSWIRRHRASEESGR